jgi:hypothetical protein
MTPLHTESSDPTPTPTAGHTKKVTVIRVDNGQPFIADAQLVTNADGSVSFQLPDGKFAGQKPEKYGEREDGDATQQYQRATLAGEPISGSTVTFTPHPDYPARVYLLGVGQVYPA